MTDRGSDRVDQETLALVNETLTLGQEIAGSVTAAETRRSLAALLSKVGYADPDAAVRTGLQASTRVLPRVRHAENRARPAGSTMALDVTSASLK